MDINDMRSVVTLASFVLFVGVAIWTWQRARRDAFDEAAQLPFADEKAASAGAVSTGEPQ
jgi:cytochrome c oxidase cbb3-type subunit 4